MGEIAELVGKLLAHGAAYRVEDPAHPDVYFDSTATGHFGYLSHYDEPTMIALSRERGGDPDRPGKRHPADPLLWRTARAGEPSWEKRPGPRPPRLARRVRCHRAEPAGQAGSTWNGGGSGPHLPAPRVRQRTPRRSTGVQPLRRAQRAQRHDRSGRREDVQVPWQPGVRVQSCAPKRVVLLLSGRPCSPGITAATGRGTPRAAEPRRRPGSRGGGEAVGRERRWAGTEELVRRLRTHLADDLDTPAALAAVDTWADSGPGGGDREAPTLVRAAVDALLGVRLS